MGMENAPDLTAEVKDKYLGAQRFYPDDKRNEHSTFVSIDTSIKGTWTLEKVGYEKNHYHIKLDGMDHLPGLTAAEGGQYLGAQRYYNLDKRNSGSSFTSLDQFPGTWELEYAGDRHNPYGRKIPQYHIKLAAMDGFQGLTSEEGGKYLGAQRFYARDRRNSASTYVSIDSCSDANPFCKGRWEFEPVGRSSELDMLLPGSSLYYGMFACAVMFVLFAIVAVRRQRAVIVVEPLLG